MHNKIVFIYMVFLAMGVVVFNGSAARAAVIHVTTTQDQVPGSLRAAIDTANANNEDNTIHIPAGTYFLRGAASEDANAGGDLDLDTNRSMSIIGAGAGITIIDGNHTDRVLHVLKGTVSLTGVTLQNGAAPDGSGDWYEYTTAEDGGGIYNQGTLTLSGCSITSNSAGDGASGYGCSSGASGGGIINLGKLTLIFCDISDNRAGYGGSPLLCPCRGGSGGGIYSSGTLELQDCTIGNNKSGSRTGNYDYTEGAGGGIFNSGEANLTGCTINNNQTGGAADGGGVFNGGSAALTDCTVSNNTTGQGYGDGWECQALIAGYGGGIRNRGTLLLTRCLISNNKAGDGQDYYNLPAGEGGGIYHSGKEATLTNCTISNNRSGDGRGGGGGCGGGIAGGNGLTLIDCTVCYNSTGEGSHDPTIPGGGWGGGICGSGVSIKNTIIAHNQVALFGKGPDVSGKVNSLGYNLIEDLSDCTISGILTGNITAVDPLLAPLADNGGPTRTHALLLNSPAIDAGNSAGITGDQRGFTRPVDITAVPNVDDGSDIGAYEFDTANTLYTISGRITCGGTGLPGVTVTFASSTGSAATDDSGYYRHVVISGWSGTATPWKEGYTIIPANKIYSPVTANLANQDFTAAAIPPQITLNHTQLYFGATKSGDQTGPQSLSITNSGGGVLNWTARDNAHWINCTPNSGSNSGVVRVTVDASGLSARSYTGVITIEDPRASNSPREVEVTLTVYKPGSSDLPFGDFDTPRDGAVVMSSIPVTGWVLDDIGVESVTIYRDPTPVEGSELIYIGAAVMVEGARPDIEAAYPGWPDNYKAGWGYMLLTYGLPDRGSGIFTLYAKAADREGNVIDLGTKTIYSDNDQAVKPFGAMDTPTQGGTASGNAYVNHGWALTPLPCYIPSNGSTINVWVDGVPLGHPYYNIRRVDIEDLFPEYHNRRRAGGQFWLDTTRYENGIHTIAWSVTDSCGHSDGIGNRYFIVRNLDGSNDHRAGSQWQPGNGEALESFANSFEPLRLKKGYNPEIEPEILYPHANGRYTIDIHQLERIEIRLTGPAENSYLIPGTQSLTLKDTTSTYYRGYLTDGSRLKPLPIGSTLDVVRGIFYWQPGPGFLGLYEFLFLEKTGAGELQPKRVSVRIRPILAE